MDKFKSGIIIVLAAVLVLYIFFGGKKVTKFQDEISLLKGEKKALQSDISNREKLINVGKDSLDLVKKQLAALKQESSIQAQEKLRIIQERDEAMAKLQGITSDSSYQFLQRVAYNYPSILKYLFNELQVRGIHSNYIKLQSAELLNKSLEGQLNNCGAQVEKYEKIKTGMESIVSLQSANLADCKNIIKNDSIIIRDQDKTAKKERHRKNFWRITTMGEILVIIGLIL